MPETDQITKIAPDVRAPISELPSNISTICRNAFLIRVSKKEWPILFSNLPYKMGYYFLDTQYKWDLLLDK